ncbi:HPP family protein [Vibrio vulnificus]|uniref:HPP family protein n=1 Tax=Vibrio vulnificus TaxID=672 RepID=UPI0023AF284A|nr:HPP family protein [Vibrio vulnificus]
MYNNTFVGLFFAHYIGENPINLALASGLAVSVMLLTKTTHPPAGANPLLIMMTGQNWDFLLTPVLLGAVSIVVICQGMQKALKVQAS